MKHRKPDLRAIPGTQSSDPVYTGFGGDEQVRRLEMSFGAMEFFC
jgi:hypothetical protein